MISIFVAKLDFGVDNDQLKALFEEYGRVLKASVALDRETKKSRGFGFVEMADDEEGRAAIDALDGYMINGRPIAVKEAEDRGGSKGPAPRPGGPSATRPSNDRPAPREGFSKPSFTPREDIVSVPPVFPLDADGGEFRKKDREPKKKEKPKNHKMEAYRKSGKDNRFLFDDEDDDVPPLFDFNDEEE